MIRKYKQLIIGTVIGLTIASAGTALAYNGSFSGFPVVNVNLNGNHIVSDVPAIDIYGTTMVPLRVISESFGANVSWDQDTQSVSIQNGVSILNGSNIDWSGFYKDEILKLKLYNKIADEYRKLTVISDVLGHVQDDLINNYPSLAITALNEAVAMYNDDIKNVNSLITEANKSNIDITDMNYILTQYSNVIDQYRTAINQNSPSQSAFNLQLDASKQAIKRYNDFYNIIQNF